jgi:Glycoside-hydrolase family GH114
MRIGVVLGGLLVGSTLARPRIQKKDDLPKGILDGYDLAEVAGLSDENIEEHYIRQGIWPFGRGTTTPSTAVAANTATGFAGLVGGLFGLIPVAGPGLSMLATLALQPFGEYGGATAVPTNSPLSPFYGYSSNRPSFSPRPTSYVPNYLPNPGLAPDWRSSVAPDWRTSAVPDWRSSVAPDWRSSAAPVPRPSGEAGAGGYGQEMSYPALSPAPIPTPLPSPVPEPMPSLMPDPMPSPIPSPIPVPMPEMQPGDDMRPWPSSEAPNVQPSPNGPQPSSYGAAPGPMSQIPQPMEPGPFGSFGGSSGYLPSENLPGPALTLSPEPSYQSTAASAAPFPTAYEPQVTVPQPATVPAAATGTGVAAGETYSITMDPFDSVEFAPPAPTRRPSQQELSSIFWAEVSRQRSAGTAKPTLNGQGATQSYISSVISVAIARTKTVEAKETSRRSSRVPTLNIGGYGSSSTTEASTISSTKLLQTGSSSQSMTTSKTASSWNSLTGSLTNASISSTRSIRSSTSSSRAVSTPYSLRTSSSRPWISTSRPTLPSIATSNPYGWLFGSSRTMGRPRPSRTSSTSLPEETEIILPPPLSPAGAASMVEGWDRHAKTHSFQIILSGIPDIKPSASSVTPNVDVYDVDLFLADKTIIQTLHKLNKTVICYFSGGTYEPGRPDSKQFSNADMGSRLKEWPNEKWLKLSSAAVRRIMVNRIQLAHERGCDAIDPDNVGKFSIFSTQKRVLTTRRWSSRTK